ncbi:homoaconitase large subunit [Bacillota bacterium]
MGKTISEKLLAAAAGLDSATAGDILTVNVDRLMSNDGTTHLTIDMYRNLPVNSGLTHKDKLVFIADHNVPSDSPSTAAAHKKMRDFAQQYGIAFYEGKGICHQIMMENYVCPGELILGADSHTCTYGALGAFGTGVGNTDFLYAMVTGRSWVLVPETILFNLTGKFKEGVYPRDLILTIIGDIGADGASYKTMEFSGDAAGAMSVNQRMALTNMAVEAGAKTGIFEADEKALEFLASHGRKPKHIFKSDSDASYEKVYNYDLSNIRPVVARPDNVDDVVPVDSVKNVKIHQAFIGSCNSGRIEELRIAADILKDRKIDSNVRLLISPASDTVYREALNEGLMEIFMEAGAIVMNSNCSVCWGSCQGVIGEGEVLISTGTRNFKGRAGHKDSKVYLASAATVAASALAGEITRL